MSSSAVSTVVANLKNVGGVIGGLNLMGFAVSAILTTHKITDLVSSVPFLNSSVDFLIQNDIITIFEVQLKFYVLTVMEIDKLVPSFLTRIILFIL